MSSQRLLEADRKVGISDGSPEKPWSVARLWTRGGYAGIKSCLGEIMNEKSTNLCRHNNVEVARV